MVRCLLAVGLGLLGACNAGEEAELSVLLAELKDIAREQQAALDAYGAAAKEQPAERRLVDDAGGPRTIYAGTQQLPNTGHYGVPAANTSLLSHVWLLLCGALAIFMQAGFAMIEVGHGRVMNAQVILVKNLTVMAASCWGWWAFGWSFAHSGPWANGLKENKFAGKEEFLGHHFMISRADGQVEPSHNMMRWFFSWAFCAASTAIASAGISERVHFAGSLIFAFLYSSFIYPIVVAWTWGNGWLADVNDAGYMDFAGSGIVFMTGGIAALVGTLVAGRRTGRFEGISGKEKTTQWPKAFQPHSIPLVMMGTFVLWFGWYGFACGSTMSMGSIEKAMLAAQVAMTLTISAVGGGMVVLLLRFATTRKYDIPMLCNGILAGLVSISAGCSTVECGSALAIGISGGILYFVIALAIRMAKVDDPVDAFAVYGVPGIWGVIAAALFDWGNGFNHVHGWQGFKCMTASSLSCKTELGGALVAANFALIGAVFAWVFFLSAFVFLWLKVTKLIKNQPYSEEDKPREGERSDYVFEDVYAGGSI